MLKKHTPACAGISPYAIIEEEGRVIQRSILKGVRSVFGHMGHHLADEAVSKAYEKIMTHLEKPERRSIEKLEGFAVTAGKLAARSVRRSHIKEAKREERWDMVYGHRPKSIEERLETAQVYRAALARLSPEQRKRLLEKVEHASPAERQSKSRAGKHLAHALAEIEG